MLIGSIANSFGWFKQKRRKKTANFGHLSSGDDLQAQTRFQCAHKYHWPTSFIKCSCEAKPMRPNRKTDPHSYTHIQTYTPKNQSQ